MPSLPETKSKYDQLKNWFLGIFVAVIVYQQNSINSLQLEVRLLTKAHTDYIEKTSISILDLNNKLDKLTLKPKE